MTPQHRDPLPAGAVEVEARTGDLDRITSERTVTATCADCALTTNNTGAAYAHARSTRHRVDVTYAARFTIVPRALPLPEGGAE